jgi:GDPmannose 4,6-dehydratase
MKRAAITGIAGQDGTFLTRFLLRKGYDVHGLLQFPFDREEPGLRRRLGPDGLASVHWYTGSMEDPFSIVRFLKASQPDEVYHLAGLTDSRQSFMVPEESVHAITLGTLRLLEATRELCPAARLFLASSSEVFGIPATSPQDENTLRQPVTPYGIAKVAADQFARLHREKYGQFVSVGILYNHESPLRPPNYLSSRVARAVAEISKGRLQTLELGDLTSERDWSDVRDFVRGFWQALQASQSGEFVFSSGQSHRVSDLVDCAFRVAGLDYREYVKVVSREQAANSVSTGLLGNSAKAQADLGWKRVWTFEQTIENIVRCELESRSEFDRSNPG